jgi:SOS response regulatory protein OraA/RecX
MKKDKQLQEAKELLREHRIVSNVIERLILAGWIDEERIADLIASDLMKNRYSEVAKELDINKLK